MAGLEYAREHGTKSGRPIGRPKRIFDREQVLRLRAQGMSLRHIAEELGLGLGTVVRTLKSHTSRETAPDLLPDVPGTLTRVPQYGSVNLEQQA
jgi:DNA invertase Pin-like site-specific DNA recombinase